MYNIFLLSQCNLRCGYCFADEIMGRGPKNKNGGKSAARTMSIGDYDRILDFLASSQIPVVSLVGGEPTLHPEFFKIVEMSLERGFSVSVKSNAAWRENIRRGIQLLPDEGVHFLLNINHPSALGARLWDRVADNARGLKGRNLDFQFNIDHLDFEYEYILDLASEVHPGKIVWSLSNLVKGGGSDSFADPVAVREQYSKKLLTFIVEAGERGFQTVGVHGITPCMFSEQDYLELHAHLGKLEATCNPVFDILPDLSVLYCFPMSGFLGEKSINDYPKLQALNMEFQQSLAFMRSDLYPLAECCQCQYARQEMCHGGCLARHVDGYEKPDLDDIHFLDRIPLLTKNFQAKKRLLNSKAPPKEAYYLLDMRSGKHDEIDCYLYALLNAADGQKSFADLCQDVFARFEEKPAIDLIFREIIIQLIQRGVLILRPFRKTESSIPAPYLEVEA